MLETLVATVVVARAKLMIGAFSADDWGLFQTAFMLHLLRVATRFQHSGLGRDTFQFEQFCVGLFHIILKVPTNELGLTESYRADILEVTAALLISTDQCKDGAAP